MDAPSSPPTEDTRPPEVSEQEQLWSSLFPRRPATTPLPAPPRAAEATSPARGSSELRQASGARFQASSSMWGGCSGDDGGRVTGVLLGYLLASH